MFNYKIKFMAMATFTFFFLSLLLFAHLRIEYGFELPSLMRGGSFCVPNSLLCVP